MGRRSMRKQVSPAMVVALLIAVVVITGYLFARAARGPAKRIPGYGYVGHPAQGRGEPGSQRGRMGSRQGGPQQGSPRGTR
jgi:hypothetical protein